MDYIIYMEAALTEVHIQVHKYKVALKSFLMQEMQILGLGLGLLNQDVYVVNPTTTSVMKAPNPAWKPAARAYHVGVLIASNNSMFIFGGSDLIGAKNDAFYYSFASSSVPPGRPSLKLALFPLEECPVQQLLYLTQWLYSVG
jgi:hypothetical protein